MGTYLESVWQDLAYGIRSLRKNPGYAAVVVLTLALGIGANAAIFSVVNGVLIRPLPYERGEELVVLKQQAPKVGVDNAPFSVKEVEDYRDRNHSLSSVVEYHSMSFILLGRGEPERVQTGVVSANFFDFLGVKPLHGRAFLAGEDQKGAEPVLVLSHEYWKRSHGADPKIVGQTFRMNDRVHTVIGVLPPFPQYPDENDVYMPVSACPFRSSESTVSNRTARMVRVFGRLSPGTKVEEARVDLGTIAGALMKEHPDAYPADRGYNATAESLQDELTRRGKPTFLLLLGTAGLVLLIACANVANLALSRLVRREREMAVRSALGARRGRLLRQLLTESTILAVAGGTLGLAFASWGLDLLIPFAARFTTRAAEIHLDANVFLFTLAVSILTGLVFGSLPALPSRFSLTPALKEGSGPAATVSSSNRVRHALIVAQVAVSFMLLIGAGLMLRSLNRLQRVDPGFDPERVMTMRIGLNWSKYTEAAHGRAFFNELLRKVQAMPGVVSAGASFTFPLNQSFPATQRFQIEGRPVPEGQPRPVADFRVASTDYFTTLRIPLVRGRTFTAADDEKASPVVVINQRMARRWWGEKDPIGSRITFDGQNWTPIVGVVGDVRQDGLDVEPGEEVFFAFPQNASVNVIVVRTATDPTAMAHQFREAVYSIDPEQPVTHIRTLEEVRHGSMATPRLTTILLGLFAALALTITAAGLAGVISFSVSQRTHEIGIRLALGAGPRAVLSMIMRQGMGLIAAGVGLGVAGAYALGRIMSGLLFQVGPHDPPTYLSVAVILLAVAAAACFVPARRATGIDPLGALRTE